MSDAAPALVPDDVTALTVATWRFLETEMVELKTPLLRSVQPMAEFLDGSARIVCETDNMVLTHG